MIPAVFETITREVFPTTVFFLKLISIVCGFLFPFFLLRALRDLREHTGQPSFYTALSCISFGFIVFTMMGLLPNG